MIFIEKNSYKSWGGLKKQLENLLCDSLKDRISYFYTTYRKAHDHYGRASINLDKNEILNCEWTVMAEQWYDICEQEAKMPPHPSALEDYDASLQRYNEACDIAAREKWMPEGTLCETDFIYSASAYVNTDISEALESENYLLRVFAFMDRRMGKRTLIKIREEAEKLPDWVRKFYVLRCDAEGISLTQPASEKRFCDLHAHSTFSDGSLTPTELVAEAKRKGLCAVALTDHNTPSGLPEFLAAAEKAGIEAVPGIEFSTDYGKTELHIVGLFIKPEHYEAARAIALRMRETKLKSHSLLIERLAAVGIKLDYEEMRAKTPRGNVNRVSFAQEMLEKGYISSISEAFDRLLAKDGGFYEEPPHLPVFEVLDFLRGIGAVSVLAHPFLSFGSEEELRAFLPEAKAHGLCAMETIYSKYSEETSEKARRIAHEFGLLESGGSDFHGAAKPTVELGTGIGGNVAVPMELLEALRGKAK